MSTISILLTTQCNLEHDCWPFYYKNKSRPSWETTLFCKILMTVLEKADVARSRRRPPEPQREVNTQWPPDVPSVGTRHPGLFVSVRISYVFQWPHFFNSFECTGSLQPKKFTLLLNGSLLCARNTPSGLLGMLWLLIHLADLFPACF